MYYSLIIFLCLVNTAYAQELNFNVVVNAEQVQTTDRLIFDDMEQNFANFLNSRRWTGNTYLEHERIEGTLFLTINSMPSIGRFIANVQITSARPVFNTSYQTALLNFADRQWDFEYTLSIPIEYNDNAYISNLSSLLGFYAYVVIGMDYDSFSLLGGSLYFQKASIIVSNASSSNKPGWEALKSTRDRYALINDIINPQMTTLRENTYRYHRLGLDVFDKNPEECRKVVLEGLINMREIWSIYSSSIFIISFLDAKATEIVNIFMSASLQTKREVYDLLSTIDPRRNIYQQLIDN